MKKKITRNQALLTAVGYMIGSGIFFRADDIIASTQGNVLVAIISWTIISFMLINAGIVIALIASDHEVDGGFIGYIGYHYSQMFGEKVGQTLAFIIGWYQIIVYIPILCATGATAFMSYAFQLFGYDGSVFAQYSAAAVLVVAIFGWNAISTRIATAVSTTAGIIKIIPLVIIAICGVLFGNPTELTHTAVLAEVGTNPATAALLFAPMLSMAFSFDGWISVGSLSHDMEDPKKDLPVVFMGSVIITAIVYIAYFTGVALLMPADQIVANGDGHIGVIAENIGGLVFSKFILVGVVISILGMANSVFMAGARYTHKMASDDMLLKSDFFRRTSKYNTPLNASIFTVVTSLVIVGLYGFQAYLESNGVSTGIMISDIPMMLNSVAYLFVFYIAFGFYKQGKASAFRGVVTPIIAAIGQLFIVFTFFLVNDQAVTYTIISIVIIGIGAINALSPTFRLRHLSSK